MAVTLRQKYYPDSPNAYAGRLIDIAELLEDFEQSCPGSIGEALRERSGPKLRNVSLIRPTEPSMSQMLSIGIIEDMENKNELLKYFEAKKDAYRSASLHFSEEGNGERAAALKAIEVLIERNLSTRHDHDEKPIYEKMLNRALKLSRSIDDPSYSLPTETSLTNELITMKRNRQIATLKKPLEIGKNLGVGALGAAITAGSGYAGYILFNLMNTPEYMLSDDGFQQVGSVFVMSLMDVPLLLLGVGGLSLLAETPRAIKDNIDGMKYNWHQVKKYKEDLKLAEFLYNK